MTANVSLIRFQVHGDDRGSLIALENGHNLPFDVKRVYYIFGTKADVPRGFHAHRQLKQVLVAMSGSVTVKTEHGGKTETHLLNRPDEGLLIEGLKGNHIPNGYLSSRQAIIDAGKYDESVFLEDWYMHLQLSKIGKYKYIPDILFSYRWHESNTVSSSEYKAKQSEIFRQIYEHEKEYCFTHGYKKQWKRQWCKRFGWRAKWKKLRDFIRGKK